MSITFYWELGRENTTVMDGGVFAPCAGAPADK